MLEKIAFIYSDSKEQNNLFTPYHTRFDCAIKYGTNCEPFKFNYQCNTAHTMPNIKDVMYSLLLDTFTYDDAKDVYEFCEELGYDYIDYYEKVSFMYNICRETSFAIHNMFTDEEISKLYDETTEL